MSHKLLLDCIDNLLRDITGNKDTPFGGKVVLLAGDFRQVLPVVPRGSRAQINAASMQRYAHWPLIKVMHLKINVRVQRMLADNDPDTARILAFFSLYLLEVGEGRVPAEPRLGKDWIQLHKDMCLDPGADVDELIEAVFPDFHHNILHDPSFFADRAIMTPLNTEVDRINTIVQSKMTGTSQQLKSADRIKDPALSTLYPTEFLNTLTPSGFPPHILELKVGCPVMLLRNLNPKKGLANGTRLIVREIHSRLLDCEILNGPKAGDRVLIPRITCIADEKSGLPFEFCRHQYPIRLSYARLIIMRNQLYSSTRFYSYNMFITGF